MKQATLNTVCIIKAPLINSARFIAIAASLLIYWSAAHAGTTDIAPAPMGTSSTAVVKPNLMFILDDSRSMDRTYMPDWVTGSYCKDTDSSLKACSWGDPAYNNANYNAVYYNPKVTYDPPTLYDGTSMESYDTAAEWAVVPNDGYGVQFSGTTDLSGAVNDYVYCDRSSPPVADRSFYTIGGYCRRPINNSGIWAYPSSARPYKLAVIGAYAFYYTNSLDPIEWCDTKDANGFGTGVNPPQSGMASCNYKKDYTNPFNGLKFRYPKYGTWERVDIEPSRTTYPRAVTRVDCSGAVGATGCTFDEEMTNFANWWAYYRSRMQAMKSAAGHAFKPITDKFRVGFITITPNSPVDSNQYLRINDFDATHKQAWYNKLYAQDAPGGGGTPLREALSRVGRYYANKTSGINQGMSDDPIQYSCQQNFAILTSDGYWTSNAGDKLDGSSIGNHDNNITTAPRPLYDGNNASGTLADVAQYYYMTDLRANGSTGALGTDVGINNVPGKPATDPMNDTATHQHLTTFTVGMGVDGTLLYSPDYKENPTSDFLAIKSGTLDWPTPSSGNPTGIDDMWHAAVNGRGKYFNASDPVSLASGLTEALVSVNATIGSSAAAATSNLEPIAGDNFVYIANYETVYWNGDVEARTIDLSTGGVNPTPIWSAQVQLDNKTIQTSPGGGARTIYFHKPGATNNLGSFYGYSPYMDATELSWFSTAWISGGGGPQLTQWSSLDATQQSAAGYPEYLVDFLRGDATFEDRASNPALYRLYRNRTHVLGDIVNAQPVYVKTANAKYTDSGYGAFKDCINDGVGCSGARVPTVYVSANDGMLHALNGDTGEERWAFIPRLMMPKLYLLADKDYASRHQYYVDGSPTVGDVYDPAAGAWKTILVGGYNSGGRGYYALDITDPLSPKALWEFTVRDAASCPSATTLGTDTDDCDLGLSYGNPVITKLTSGDWVVMVTSGYNNVAPGDGKGYLYVLDPITGVIEKKIKAANATQSIDPGSTTTPLGLAKINNWVDNTSVDNTTLRIYGGDLEGNLWRFDPNSGTAYVVATFKDGRGAATAKRQPVTTKPELGESGSMALIAVGTGRYLGTSDLPDTQPQSIYTIKDETNGVAPATPVDARGSTVVEQVITDTTDGLGTPIRTITNNVVDLATKDGWRVDLPISGERVNVDPKLQLGTLIVASNVPANDACSAGGFSYLNYLDYKSGSFIASSGTNVIGNKIANSLAVGISVVRLPNKKTVAIVTTSENKYPTLAPPFQAQAPQGRRNSWREITE
ncbi:MAG: PQQ-binding-like beta-propeller repeat protein [Betaproteobacteria bacterium]|nr:MAG: PQQ-binding-like beta-propeller repeat protein [Betaproteobacteria bacterium]